VVTNENHKDWIEKAQNLKQRELEREVVKINPRAAVRDSSRPIAENLNEWRLGVNSRVDKKRQRVQDLLSQQSKSAASMEDAVEAGFDAFLEKNDPLEIARRNVGKKKKKSPNATHGRRVPAAVRHEVMLNHKGRCGHVDHQGKRCTEMRWLDFHHKIPFAFGGKHTVENLVLLCKGHHQMTHDLQSSRIEPVTASQNRHP